MERTVRPELEQALTELRTATDSRGLLVRLCAKPLDLDYVRDRMLEIAACWFKHGPTSMFISASSMTPTGEECAARNLALLAKLYEALLIERRVNPDACKPQTS
jgi:hypothetical protein